MHKLDHNPRYKLPLMTACGCGWCWVAACVQHSNNGSAPNHYVAWFRCVAVVRMRNKSNECGARNCNNAKEKLKKKTTTTSTIILLRNFANANAANNIISAAVRLTCGRRGCAAFEFVEIGAHAHCMLISIVAYMRLKKVDQSAIFNNVFSTRSHPYYVHQLVWTWFVILAHKLSSFCCWRCNSFVCNLIRLAGIWKKALLFLSAKHFRIFSSWILTRNFVLHTPMHTHTHTNIFNWIKLRMMTLLLLLFAVIVDLISYSPLTFNYATVMRGWEMQRRWNVWLYICTRARIASIKLCQSLL